MRRSRIIIGILFLSMLFAFTACQSVPIPENASPYWQFEDEQPFEIGNAKVAFVSEPKDDAKGFSQPLYISFHYERLYFPEGNYMKFHVVRVRNVEVETEETQVFFDDETLEPSYEIKGIRVQYFTVMQVQVDEVYYNGSAFAHEFQSGEQLLVYTPYVAEVYGVKDEYVDFHEGGVYYGCIGIIKPTEQPSDYIGAIQELAGYTIDFTRRYVYELQGLGLFVSIPECIWKGEGFDQPEKYRTIRVPVNAFEDYYKNQIAKYCR